MNFHAADVNNDDQVNISDAIAILRHIVKLETINSFDLIDGNGRKTQVEPGMSEDGLDHRRQRGCRFFRWIC